MAASEHETQGVASKETMVTTTDAPAPVKRRTAGAARSRQRATGKLRSAMASRLLAPSPSDRATSAWHLRAFPRRAHTPRQPDDA
eukprot:CAMPEP_0170429200 /NCGR_PEP_ID=MMETSP0117_2-20130122/40176_1 /TAXON_ID=400756 /ORGANISM="Durinskia baltica, Strain CSIRO CS-38" /LENGTH=84 /DNA_ID=CAMNT_0010688543 /DNA_START=72 /DNA_END=323 /DNA_ORIENTATION=-